MNEQNYVKDNRTQKIIYTIIGTVFVLGLVGLFTTRYLTTHSANNSAPVSQVTGSVVTLAFSSCDSNKEIRLHFKNSGTGVIDTSNITIWATHSGNLLNYSDENASGRCDSFSNNKVIDPGGIVACSNKLIGVTSGANEVKARFAGGNIVSGQAFCP